MDNSQPITDPNRLLAPPSQYKEPGSKLFKKGNPGGPGRPKGMVKADYYNALKKAISPKDLTLMMKEMFKITMDSKASASNRIRAAKYITDIYLGKEPLIQLTITDKPKEVEAIFSKLADDEKEVNVA